MGKYTCDNPEVSSSDGGVQIVVFHCCKNKKITDEKALCHKISHHQLFTRFYSHAAFKSCGCLSSSSQSEKVTASSIIVQSKGINVFPLPLIENLKDTVNKRHSQYSTDCKKKHTSKKNLSNIAKSFCMLSLGGFSQYVKQKFVAKMTQKHVTEHDISPCNQFVKCKQFA